MLRAASSAGSAATRNSGRSARFLLRVGPWLLLFVLFASFAIANVSAESRDDRRVRAGARLLRSLLAAEVAIESKAGRDGRLEVLILSSDARAGNVLSQLIAPSNSVDPAAIRGKLLHVSQSTRLPAKADGIVAIFLGTLPRDAEWDAIVRYAGEHRILLFSPFEGHVERGAHAGLSVEAKVLPYLNERALSASGIELKPFFMRVAKVYR